MLQQICDQTMYDLLYEARGDLLDTRAIAAINERPFYLGKELGSIKDQVSLIERITVDAQNVWFESFANLPHIAILYETADRIIQEQEQQSAEVPDPEQERKEILEIAEWFDCGFLFDDAPVQLAQDLGTRFTISGGDVVELDAPRNHDSDFASWDSDPF